MIWLQAALVGATASLGVIVGIIGYGFWNGASSDLTNSEAVAVVLGFLWGLVYGVWCAGLAWWVLS